jgi:hypothetical protein
MPECIVLAATALCLAVGQPEETSFFAVWELTGCPVETGTNSTAATFNTYNFCARAATNTNQGLEPFHFCFSPCNLQLNTFGVSCEWMNVSNCCDESKTREIRHIL